LGAPILIVPEDGMKLSVYGTPMCIERINDEWIAFHVTPEGKKWRATDLPIPSEMDRAGVITYIADLLHECATVKHPTVELLED
jgi:hypothetical protein